MISVIIAIALLGLVVWLLTTFIPMPEKFKTAIYIVAVICLVGYLLQVFGLWNGGYTDIPVPQLR